MQDAVALHQQGRLREAEKLYARVLKAAPDHFDALHLLGLVKAQRGQMGEAFRLMSAALKINPKAPDALMNLANVLHALKRDAEALDCLDKALALRPGDLNALHQSRQCAAHTLSRPQDALGCFDAGAGAQSAPWRRHAQSRHRARGARPHRTRRSPISTPCLALTPDHPDALYNRGNALSALGRYAEALAAFDRALAAAPYHVQGLEQSRPRAASAQPARRRGREFRQGDRAAKGLCRRPLQSGAGAAHAWRPVAAASTEYEWRWKRSGMTDTRRGYGKPLWLGEYPLARKTILLHAEQGLGDTIQFARYAPLLARAGATVVLEVQPELKSSAGGPRRRRLVSCARRDAARL